jgi:hypothetical protein
MKDVVMTVYSLNLDYYAGTADDRLNNRQWRYSMSVYSLNVKRETVERVYIGRARPLNEMKYNVTHDTYTGYGYV